MFPRSGRRVAERLVEIVSNYTRRWPALHAKQIVILGKLERRAQHRVTWGSRLPRTAPTLLHNKQGGGC